MDTSSKYMNRMRKTCLPIHKERRRAAMNDNKELIQNVEKHSQELYIFKWEMEKGEITVV